jgi:hypothetical protein
VELDADGVPLGAIRVAVDGADPQPSDDAGSPLRGLLVRGAGLGTPGAHPGALTRAMQSKLLGPQASGARV